MEQFNLKKQSNVELGSECCHTLNEKNMPPQIIRAPFAGAERTAEVLGVSRKRTRELILLAKRAIEADPELRSLRTERINGKKKTASRRKRKR